MHEERLQGLRDAASPLDLVQQWEHHVPVVDTASYVLVLLIVGVHPDALEINRKHTQTHTHGSVNMGMAVMWIRARLVENHTSMHCPRKMMTKWKYELYLTYTKTESADFRLAHIMFSCVV